MPSPSGTGRQWFVWSGVAIGLGFLLAGCDDSSDAPSPSELSRRQEAETSAPVAGGGIDIPSKLHRKPTPLDAFVDTPRETAILDYATQVVAAACMHDLGYQVAVPPFDDLVAWHTWDVEHQRSRAFGLTDRDEAAVFGYGEAMPPPKPDPGITDSEALAAYRGDGLASPDDPACAPRAEDVVYDQPEVDYNASPLPVRLQIEASARASARPDYQSVYADLGGCLEDAGYDVPDPERPFASQGMQEIMGGGMDRDYGAPAPAAEVAVALADVDCKTQVNLVRRLETIISEEEDDLIERNALALEEYQRDREDALQRATRIMEGSAAP